MMSIEATEYADGAADDVWRCIDCDSKMPVIDYLNGETGGPVIWCPLCDRELGLKHTVMVVTRVRFKVRR